MVVNDFFRDYRVLLHITRKKKSEVAREMGIKQQLLDKYLYKAGMTSAYVKAVEQLGYDIKIGYVNRETGEFMTTGYINAPPEDDGEPV